MCFNAALVQSAEIIEELYGVRFPKEQFRLPSYFTSAFEHPPWPILKQGKPGSFVPALWGLIPNWTDSADKAGSIRDKTVNARFESLESKPSFRGLEDSHRCGVLVDGFFEWRFFEGRKFPYHISMPGKRPFLLAGIWDRWKDPGSKIEVETFSVITVAAKGLLAEIHNTKLRMPLILGKKSGQLWLNPGIGFRECSAEIVPFYKSLAAWPVSKEVSSPGEKRNRAEIQSPFKYPELPVLSSYS